MKRFLKYVKPYKLYFILGPLCMIVEVIGEVVLPRLFADIINAGVGSETALGLGTGYVIWRTVLMVLCAVCMLLGGVGGAYFGAKAAVNFASDLRADLFSKVQSFSFSNIDKFSAGSLVTRMTNDVTQLQNFVNMLLRMCLRAPGMLIGAVIMAITMNPQLSLVLAVSVPLVLLVQVFVIKIGFPRFRDMQSKIDGLNNTVQENLTNIRVVKSFVREDFERKKFGKANTDLKNSGLRAMDVMISMMPLMMIIMNFTTLAVLWFGGRQVIDSIMPVGDLSVFITYITQILMSLMMVSMLFINSSRALASAGRIGEVLSEESDINDIGALYPEKKVEKGEIEFRGVSFKYYKNREENVLQDINLKIAPGSTVGIIGGTGSGKSTLVSLIPRLYDADEGEILVDGVNVKDYSLYALRDGVGMVLQKNVLFSGTVMENLLWGDENADIDEVRAAGVMAQADNFVMEHPEGYDYRIGQGGSGVSGGQKQRLCIARALLRKPKILILDDSTSAVDTATEAKIREAFKSTLQGTTKIIIAQRISSVRDADMIVVMDDGKIAAVGNHEKLLEISEEYREIYISQSSEKEAK